MAQGGKGKKMHPTHGRLKILLHLYDLAEAGLRQMGVLPGKSGRHMIYPYTYTAKIAQFPYFFYMRKNYVFHYYPVGLAITSYVFWHIHCAVNSPAAVKNWAESQRKLAEKEHEH